MFNRYPISYIMSTSILVLAGIASSINDPYGHQELLESGFNWNKFSVIKSELLNPETLQAMGLSQYMTGDVIQEAHSSLGMSFRLRIPSAYPNHIFIPKNTSLLFIFKTRDRIEIHNEQDIESRVRYWLTAMPFSLPKYHYIVNYFMMIPQEAAVQIQTTVKAGRWLEQLGIQPEGVPVTQYTLDTTKPILTFIFQSGNQLQSFVAYSDDLTGFTSDDENDGLKSDDVRNTINNSLLQTSSDTAKAILASNEHFFDDFARIWVSKLGHSVLHSSTFCHINSEFSEQNYCLRIDPQEAKLSVLTSTPEQLPSRSHCSHETKSHQKRFSKKARFLLTDLEIKVEKRQSRFDDPDTQLKFNVTMILNDTRKWDEKPKKVRLFRRSQVNMNALQYSAASSLSSSSNSKAGLPCVQITWKRVFEHAIFGHPTNFCVKPS